MASESADALWFRIRYSLPPNDPRLLELTDIDLAIEREKFLFLDDKLLRECLNCGVKTYRDYCVVCGSDELAARTGDPELDRLIEDGDEDVDFDKLFGG